MHSPFLTTKCMSLHVLNMFDSNDNINKTERSRFLPLKVLSHRNESLWVYKGKDKSSFNTWRKRNGNSWYLDERDGYRISAFTVRTGSIVLEPQNLIRTEHRNVFEARIDLKFASQLPTELGNNKSWRTKLQHVRNLWKKIFELWPTKDKSQREICMKFKFGRVWIPPICWCWVSASFQFSISSVSRSRLCRFCCIYIAFPRLKYETIRCL